MWLCMLINNWWQCYTQMYIVALVLHLLASLLCHLIALNKIMLIAYERVPDSWSGCWMCMISVAIYTVCSVVSAERPWLIEGCRWKNRLGGKDCEKRNTKCRKLLSQKQSFGNTVCLFASAVFPRHSNIHNKWQHIFQHVWDTLVVHFFLESWQLGKAGISPCPAFR